MLHARAYLSDTQVLEIACTSVVRMLLCMTSKWSFNAPDSAILEVSEGPHKVAALEKIQFNTDQQVWKGLRSSGAHELTANCSVELKDSSRCSRRLGPVWKAWSHMR